MLGRGLAIVRFADLAADSKLAACLGALSAIVFAALAFVAIDEAAIDARLERTIAESRGDSVAVPKMFDRLQDLEGSRAGRAVDAIAGAAAAADGAAALFDEAVRAARRSAGRIERARLAVVDIGRPGAGETNGLDRGSIRRFARPIRGDALEMRKLPDDVATEIHARLVVANATARGSRTSLFEMIGAAIAIAIAFTFLVLRWCLIRPVQTLAIALRSAREPLPGLHRGDEAGQIARSLEAARAAISAEARAEAEQAARIRRHEADARLDESRSFADSQHVPHRARVVDRQDFQAHWGCAPFRKVSGVKPRSLRSSMKRGVARASVRECPSAFQARAADNSTCRHEAPRRGAF